MNNYTDRLQRDAGEYGTFSGHRPTTSTPQGEDVRKEAEQNLVEQLGRLFMVLQSNPNVDTSLPYISHAQEAFEVFRIHRHDPIVPPIAENKEAPRDISRKAFKAAERFPPGTFHEHVLHYLNKNYPHFIENPASGIDKEEETEYVYICDNDKCGSVYTEEPDRCWDCQNDEFDKVPDPFHKLKTKPEEKNTSVTEGMEDAKAELFAEWLSNENWEKIGGRNGKDWINYAGCDDPTQQTKSTKELYQLFTELKS